MGIAVLAAMLSATLAGPAAAAELATPIAGGCVSSPYGWRVLSVPLAGHAHPGIDIAAAAGTPIRAAAAGRVVAVRRRGLGGLAVRLRHAGGLETYYAHIGSLAPAFAEGRAVAAAGEKLGRVGRTGMNFGAHLYFAVWRDGVPTDPEPLLALPRCR